MSLESELTQGQQASLLLQSPLDQTILQHPLLQEVISNRIQQLTHAWMESPQRDSDGRERLYLLISAWKTLQGDLQSVVDTGRLAEFELERKRTLSERARDALDAWRE